MQLRVACLAADAGRIACTSCTKSNHSTICDSELIGQCDQLEIDVSKVAPDLVVKNLTKKTTIPAKQDLSEREKAMLKAEASWRTPRAVGAAIR